MKRDFFKESLAEPRYQEGSPIPLFDKLIDLELDEAEEFPPKRLYNREQLIESIQEEVLKILGTRGSVRKEDLGYLAEEALNSGYPPLFGLSDFSQYDGANQLDYPRIAQLCESTIMRYEPRLSRVKVEIISYNRQTSELSGTIRGQFATGVFQGEVTFPMTLQM